VNINADDSESLFHENIKTLAHYLFVARGCQEGRALNNWIEAEAQLKEFLICSPTPSDPQAP